MTNKLLRIETCTLCGATTPVHEYAFSTYGDQGHSHVKRGAGVILVCVRCWNANVNDSIVFGENGWEWRETMFHAYIGELRGGRIKITNDRDCLSPDLIRFDERVFATEKDMLDCANAYRNRGYQVCVDTSTVFQDYL